MGPHDGAGRQRFDRREENEHGGLGDEQRGRDARPATVITRGPAVGRQGERPHDGEPDGQHDDRESEPAELHGDQEVGAFDHEDARFAAVEASARADASEADALRIHERALESVTQ